MTDFEILSRGSVFFTPAAVGFDKQYHVVGCAHVSHPWKFREFYCGEQYDWLDHVRPDAVKNVLNVREVESGSIVMSIPLEEQCYVHETRDLVVFHVAQEDAQINLMEERGFPVMPLELNASGSLQAGQPVVLVGNDKTEDESLVPCALNGVVEGSHEGHAMVSTQGDVSVMGMCGGPAVVNAGGSAIACGLIFARIDSGEYRGNTLLVTAAEISHFLQKIEKRD